MPVAKIPVCSSVQTNYCNNYGKIIVQKWVYYKPITQMMIVLENQIVPQYISMEWNGL